MELFFLLLTAIVAALIASAKGRSAIGWFIGGFFLHIIAIVIVACLPNLKKQALYQQRIEDENRLLRERLRQEQVKSRAFRKHVVRRLDDHDRQLEVDTRTPGRLSGNDDTYGYLDGGDDPYPGGSGF